MELRLAEPHRLDVDLHRPAPGQRDGEDGRRPLEGLRRRGLGRGLGDDVHRHLDGVDTIADVDLQQPVADHRHVGALGPVAAVGLAVKLQ